LDSFNNTSRDEGNIVDQIYIKQICSDFYSYYFVSPLLNYSNFFLFLYSINFVSVRRPHQDCNKKNKVRHMNIYYITVIKFQNYHKNYNQKVTYTHFCGFEENLKENSLKLRTMI